MKKPTSKKQKPATKNMASNLMLAAGLRVKIHLVDTGINDFEVNGFYSMPKAEDLIDIVNIIDEKEFTDEQLDKIHSLCWSVWYCSWSKDEKGIFNLLACSGA